MGLLDLVMDEIHVNINSIQSKMVYRKVKGMKINVEGFAGSSEYDARNLVRCRCGKHWYPSKKMFVEFLKKYEDVAAEVDVWSIEHWDTDEVTIKVELKYKISDVDTRNKLEAIK